MKLKKIFFISILLFFSFGFFFNAQATDDSVTVYVMTGKFTVASQTCTIAVNASTCPKSLDWSVKNAVSSSSTITRDSPVTQTINISGASGTQSVSVPYGTHTYYLNNSSSNLDDIDITASCATGSTWNTSICATNTYQLTVTKSGTGTGIVTSSPAGISCGSTSTTCSYTYNYNTSVTLTATASTGSTFTGWSGGGCSGTGTCTVIMTSAKSVTATFTSSIVLPTVTTQAPTSVTQETAVANGNITNTGGENNTVRGFVLSTSSKSLPGNVIYSSSGYNWYYYNSVGGYGTGAFTYSLSGLVPNTTYYIRAFSKNTAGYSYGGEVPFTTPAASCSSPCGTITSGSTCIAYLTSTADVCTSQTRTCTNGTLSGSYAYTPCTVNQYTVSFNANGGSGTTASQTANYGTTITLTANGFSRTGYTFTGWATSSSGAVAYANQASYTIGSSNVTLYAVWELSDSCGLGSSSTPQLTEPTGTDACIKGTLNSSSPADTTTSGSQAWNWSCGIVTSCSAPKYGCRITTDANYYLSQYGASGPNNNYGCSGTCYNGATNYSTCTTCVAGSAIVSGTCTPVTVSVTASPTTYNTTPSTSVSFTYTPTTNSGAIQCKLLDNTLSDLTTYTSATKDTVNTKTYTSPSGIGSYGYYIRCQNTTTTTAVGTSSLITVNTACPVNTTLGNGVCNPPTGTLTINPLSCKIGAGESSCPVDISWNTLYPINSVSAVTTEPNNTIVGGGGTGTPATTAGSVNNYNIGNTSASGGRTFYLYHNGVELNRKEVIAICTDDPVQTFWDGNKCVTPSGTISSAGCSIKEGNASCDDASLEWTITNPIGNTKIEASYGATPVVSPTSPAILSGTSAFSLDYNRTKTLTLYSGDHKVKEINTTATCANNTHWDGTLKVCKLNAPGTGDDSFTFTANPITLFEGGSSTLTWNSEISTSCSITSSTTGEVVDTKGEISGDVIVSPKVNTTYTLTCLNSTGTGVKTIETKVIDLLIRER